VSLLACLNLTMEDVGRYRDDLVGRSADYAPDLQTWGPVVVPPDSFFGLGG
jgi:hypothetical protein